MDNDAAEEARELLLTMAQRKAQIEAMQNTQGQDQERLLVLLDGQKTLVAKGSDDRTVKGTVVAAERVIIDADRLKGQLGPKLWDKVSIRVLDKGLLEAHVTTKVVDENVVASCSEVKANKPYVRISGDLMPTIIQGPVVVVASGGREKAAVKRVKAKRAAAGKPVTG